MAKLGAARSRIGQQGRTQSGLGLPAALVASLTGHFPACNPIAVSPGSGAGLSRPPKAPSGTRAALTGTRSDRHCPAGLRAARWNA